MRFHSLAVSLGVLFLSGTFLVGCGDDSGSMSKQQTAEVFGALDTTVQQALSGGVGKLDPRALGVSGTVTCTGGGTADVDGSSTETDEGGGTSSYAYSLDISFNDCIQSAGGKNFTFGGDVTIEGDASLTTGDTIDFDASSTRTGDISIEGDGISISSCELDVEGETSFTIDGSSLSADVNWDGTVCGATTSGSYSFDGQLN